jgi:hypothetical protein
MILPGEFLFLMPGYVEYTAPLRPTHGDRLSDPYLVGPASPNWLALLPLLDWPYSGT